MGKKGEYLSLYKGGRGNAPPHLPGKIAYSLGAIIDGAVGLPTLVLMRIPQYGDTISASTRRANKIASRNMGRQAKNGSK